VPQLNRHRPFNNYRLLANVVKIAIAQEDALQNNPRGTLPATTPRCSWKRIKPWLVALETKRGGRLPLFSRALVIDHQRECLVGTDYRLNTSVTFVCTVRPPLVPFIVRV
jgi:hypothetical protein